MIGFQEYQEKARSTAIYPDLNRNFTYPTLGLSGEAGEVAEKVKKILRDKKGTPTDEDREEIAKELGDVLWYVANVACEFDLHLGDIAQGNINKLASRQNRGKLNGSGDNR